MRLLSERRQSDRLYDSDHMTFRKRQNYGSKSVKRSVVAKGSREGQRQTNGAEVIFRAIKTILYDTVVVDTGHYTFIRTHTTT